MTDIFLALVSDWGAPAVAVATFLSCLAVPVPTSLMMLAAGAFVASGDLALAPVLAAAFFGAVLGDQAGFGVGRMAGAAVTGWLRANPARAGLLDRSQTTVAARGGQAVFLSRWLFSPLGPYVNLLAGGAAMRWPLFSAMSVAGEAVWVGIYVSLGFIFADHLASVASIMADSVGFLSSAVITTLLGMVLLRRRRGLAAAQRRGTGLG